jgi:hypothetical protein
VAAASPCKKACLLPCKAYNSASGLSRQVRHTKAYSSAQGLFSSGRQTEREAVPYPFFFSYSGGFGSRQSPAVLHIYTETPGSNFPCLAVGRTPASLVSRRKCQQFITRTSSPCEAPQS